MQTTVASFRDLSAARHAVDRLVEEHFPARDIHMRTTHGMEEIEVAPQRWFVVPSVVGGVLGAIVALSILAMSSGSFIDAHPAEFVFGSVLLGGFATSWFAVFYWRVAPKVPRRLEHASFDVYVDVPPERVDVAEHLLAALGGSNVRSVERPAGSA